MKIIIRFVFILFLNTIPFFLFSQTDSKSKDYYKYFDSIIGVKNSGIFNGIPYKEQYLTINGNHKFFLASDFVKGTIYFNNQPYYDVDMKYDIYEDVLIVRLPNASKYFFIKLINDKVDKFSIYDKNFIKLSNNIAIPGFYEILYQSKILSLLKKNKKRIKKLIGDDFVYYEFNEENSYFVLSDNKYYNINSKKDFIKLFPILKNNIDNFYSVNKLILKSDKDKFTIGLIKYVNTLNTH